MGRRARRAHVARRTRRSRAPWVHARHVSRPGGGTLNPLHLYRDEPFATRTHTAIRWRTCPFERLTAELPAHGRVLEIGCGHGLFATHLAIDAPGRDVLGIDVDGEKIHAAQRAAIRLGTRSLRFEAHPPGELPPGPWDAIAIVDVLYLIDRAGERELLRRLAGDLAPGGTLVVKEMAPTPRWKFELMRVQEKLSVKVLDITEGSELTFVAPDEFASWLREDGLETRIERLDRHYLHPHALVVGKKPATRI